MKFHFWILLFIGAKAYNHNQGCIFFILPPPPGGGQKYELLMGLGKKNEEKRGKGRGKEKREW